MNITSFFVSIFFLPNKIKQAISHNASVFDKTDVAPWNAQEYYSVF